MELRDILEIQSIELGDWLTPAGAGRETRWDGDQNGKIGKLQKEFGAETLVSAGLYFFNCIYLGCAGSLCCAGFPLVAAHGGSSARGRRARELWHTGLLAPHTGSSQTRDRTCVSCVGRQILCL